MSHRVVVSFAALGLTAGIVFAQGTITDGNVSFVRNAEALSTSPSADLTGVAGSDLQDHLFEFGWWFRLMSDTAEAALPGTANQSYVGDQSTIIWTGVGTGGLLNFTETAVVHDAGLSGAVDGGWVEISLQVTNTDAAPRTVRIHAMADFDVAGPADDSATIYLAPRYMRLTDIGGTRAEFWGVDAERYLVRPFGATDVATVLSDVSVTTFNNTELPFGPGDFTGGFQWTRSLSAGESRTVTVRIAVNASLLCGDSGGDSVFCQSFELQPLVGMSDIAPRLCDGCPFESPAGCSCDGSCIAFNDCCIDACLTCGACPTF